MHCTENLSHLFSNLNNDGLSEFHEFFALFLNFAPLRFEYTFYQFTVGLYPLHLKGTVHISEREGPLLCGQ